MATAGTRATLVAGPGRRDAAVRRPRPGAAAGQRQPARMVVAAGWRYCRLPVGGALARGKARRHGGSHCRGASAAPAVAAPAPLLQTPQQVVFPVDIAGVQVVVARRAPAIEEAATEHEVLEPVGSRVQRCRERARWFAGGKPLLGPQRGVAVPLGRVLAGAA